MKIGATLVIGAGGIGSDLIPKLSRVLSYHENVAKDHVMTIVDGDEVETKNLQRQGFTEDAVGKPKVESVAAFCATQRINRFIPTSLDAAGMMVRARNKDPGTALLVVLCVDNDATRKFFYDAIEEVPKDLGIVIVDAANELETAGVTLSIWQDRKSVLPTTPLQKYANLRKPGDRPPGGGCMAMAPSTPQLLVANAAASLMALLTVQAFLDGKAMPEDLLCNIRTFTMGPAGALFGGLVP